MSIIMNLIVVQILALLQIIQIAAKTNILGQTTQYIKNVNELEDLKSWKNGSMVIFIREKGIYFI